MGETVDDLSQCAPITTNADLASAGIKYNAYGKSTDKLKPNANNLEPTANAIPCGLIAKSIFTDSYAI